MGYSLSSDFFDECMETIFELIQGPNLDNMEIGITFNFVEVAREALIKYRDLNLKD